MIVLDGATSQWNRSAGPEPGDRSGRRVAGGDPLDRVEVRPDGRRVEVGRERRQARARRARSARRGSASAGTAGSTPTLRHSPRSTRGTTRTIAYWKALRGGSGTLGLLDERARRLEPPRQVADVGGALGRGVARRPDRRAATRRGARRRAPSAGPASIRAAWRASASAIDPAYGSRTWSAIRSNGRRACSSGSRQVWWM